MIATQLFLGGDLSGVGGLVGWLVGVIAQWGIVPSRAQPYSTQLYWNQLYSRVGGGRHFETSVIGGLRRRLLLTEMHIERHQVKSKPCYVRYLCRVFTVLKCAVPVQSTLP